MPVSISNGIVTASDTQLGFSDTRNGSTIPFSTSISNVPYGAGSATFTFTAFGDFDASSEWIRVQVEGIDFGIFLNNNPSDDLFHAGSDVGYQYNGAIGPTIGPSVGTVIISASDWSTIIADGRIDITYTLSGTVNNLTSSQEEYLTAEFIYMALDEGPTGPVVSTVFENENNSSITAANFLGLSGGVVGSVRAIGRIDGTAPSGDFDFYQVPVLAGQIITARVNSLSALDPTLSIFDPNGNQIAFNDTEDGSGSGDAYVETAVLTTGGTYTVRVAAAGAMQADPFNPASSSFAGASSGLYQLFVNTDRQANTASNSANTMSGDFAVNLLVGLDGDDILAGTGGGDVIEGGRGADTIYGGGGDDFIIQRTSDGVFGETVDGGTGTDTFQSIVRAASTVNGGVGQFEVDGTVVRNVEFFGIQGRDDLDVVSILTSLADTGLSSLTGTNAPNGSVVILTAGGNDQIDAVAAGIQILADGGSGNDLITTGIGNDLILGSTGNDTIVAGGGNDVLDGGADADIMSGGTGNDIYFVTAGDTVTENFNEGTDTVLFNEMGTFSTFANVEHHVLTAGGTLNGNEQSDTLLAQGSAQAFLNGSGGRDYLSGGSGNDVLSGGTGDDYMLGGAGIDTYLETGFFGVDVIGDFAAGNGGDIVRLDGLRSFAQVQSRLFQVDADGDGALDDAYIIVDAVNTIAMLNTATSSLTSANFTFV